MNGIKAFFIKSIKNLIKAVEHYPVVSGFAFLFTCIVIYRIQIDIVYNDSQNFFLNCIQLSLAFGAASSLAITAYFERKDIKSPLFVIVIPMVLVAVVYVLLYTLGRHSADQWRLSDIAMTRIVVLIFIELISFIHFMRKEKFSDALFMFQKAFVIALIYGGTLMAGTAGVAGAIEALLYNDMSSKVYMHLAAIVWFIAFMIFIGYFPKFDDSKHRTESERQPRFIEVLLSYVIIPVVLSLSAVLVLWVIKTIFTGDWPRFSELSGIVLTYAIGGIWLHLMVTHSKNKLTQFYRKIFPIISIVILAFGLWAFINHVGEESFFDREYYFIVTWSAALVVMILMIKPKQTQNFIPLILIVALVITILPFVGYHQLPVSVQVNRLESLLINEGILVDEALRPTENVEQKTREDITAMVNYLSYSESKRLPEWFDKRLNEEKMFEENFGFSPSWSIDKRISNYFVRKLEPINIEEYDWVIYPADESVIEGEKGVYKFHWQNGRENTRLEVFLNDALIVDDDFEEYFISVKEYLPTDLYNAPFEVMSYVIENDQIKLLLIFRSVEILVDDEHSVFDFLDLEVIYMLEKE